MACPFINLSLEAHTVGTGTAIQLAVQGSTHIVDRVIPLVPTRQFVLYLRECEGYHCAGCGEPLFRGAIRCRACGREVADELDGRN
jgi:hypothetical protein